MKLNPWMRRATTGMAALALSALMAGCASVPDRQRVASDPFESFNRSVFAFNDTLDGYLIKPAAQGYEAVTPQFFRTAVGNVTGNVRDVWSAINLVLQGQPGDASLQLFRVSVNTVLGLGGVLDIASAAEIYAQKEDFGQTLGVWGVPAGPFLMLPVFGPSTARDVVGLPGDLYFTPATFYGLDDAAYWSVSALVLVDTRASFLTATQLLDDVALDRYAFIRDAYLQRRLFQIWNGEPPEAPFDEGQSKGRPATGVEVSGSEEAPSVADSESPAVSTAAARVVPAPSPAALTPASPPAAAVAGHPWPLWSRRLASR